MLRDKESGKWSQVIPFPHVRNNKGSKSIQVEDAGSFKIYQKRQKGGKAAEDSIFLCLTAQFLWAAF